MFEYYRNIHVYCPGVGEDEPLGSNFVRIINHYGNFSMITWEFLFITYQISIYELNFNFTNIYLAYHKIMVYYYIDFC